MLEQIDEIDDSSFPVSYHELDIQINYPIQDIGWAEYYFSGWCRKLKFIETEEFDLINLINEIGFDVSMFLEDDKSEMLLIDPIILQRYLFTGFDEDVKTDEPELE